MPPVTEAEFSYIFVQTPNSWVKKFNRPRRGARKVAMDSASKYKILKMGDPA